MAESSNPTQIPSSHDVTPKKEPITLDRPECPNPFLPADQVEFSFEEIALTTNNEVSTPTSGIRGDIGITTFRNALRAHYLPHSSMYVLPPSIKVVKPWFATIRYSGEIGAKGTLKKIFLPPRWRLLMVQIIQYLGGKTGGHDQISNKDAIILYCLANRVEVDYAKLIWEDIIHKLNKKTREKVIPYTRFISLLLEYMMLNYKNEDLTIHPTQVFSVLNWALKPNQHEGPPFTDHMKAICNIDMHVDSQAPTTSSQTEKVPQGKKPRAKSGLRRKQSSKQTFDIFHFQSESTSRSDVLANSTTEVDLGKAWHGYAVSFLMDTAYWSSDQLFSHGLEVSSIRRIQVLDMVYWGFLDVGTDTPYLP
ncbi:hypothetical protein Tco_0255297 [Tanacetum coccineum]